MRASSSGTLAANAGADDPGATNHVDFQIEFVPADGIRLPFLGSGDLGTSPFLGSSQSR
jgi:hypothetical protein